MIENFVALVTIALAVILIDVAFLVLLFVLHGIEDE